MPGDWRSSGRVPQTFHDWLQHKKVRQHAEKFRSSRPAGVLKRLMRRRKELHAEELQRHIFHLAFWIISLEPKDTLNQHTDGCSVVLTLARYLEELKARCFTPTCPWLCGVLGAIAVNAQTLIPDTAQREELLRAMPAEATTRPEAGAAQTGSEAVQFQAQKLLDKAFQFWKVDLAAGDHEGAVLGLEEQLAGAGARRLRYIFRHAVAGLAPPHRVSSGEALPDATWRGLQRRLRRLILQCCKHLEWTDPRLGPALAQLQFLTDQVAGADEHILGIKQWQRLRAKLPPADPGDPSPQRPPGSCHACRRVKRSRCCVPGAQHMRELCAACRSCHRGCWSTIHAICSDELGANICFGAAEVAKLLQGHELNDLFLAYPLYRETIRQCRNRCPKEFAEDPRRTTMRHFEEVLRRLPRPEDAPNLRRMVRGTYSNLTGSKKFAFCQIFQECHFTNLYHQHDACNVCVEQLKSTLSFQAAIPVVALIYHTGSRGFVGHVITEVQQRYRRSHLWTVSQEYFGFWKALLESYLRQFTLQVEDRNAPLPELYHRRFRPMLLWNNQVRKRLSEEVGGLADTSGVESVRRWLRDHALRQLRARASVLARRAESLAACRTYETLYRAVRAALDVAARGAGELDFHAKNIANLLEPWLPQGAREEESEANGLGPGFRQMAHICHGKGKQDGLLSRGALEAELEATTARLAERLPEAWPKPRKRHVQAMYCELQKFFFYLRKGHPAVTFRRGCSAMSLASLDALARRKAQARRVPTAHRKRARPKRAVRRRSFK